MPRPTLLLPIALLLVAMTAIQGGASLAKSLFPIVGPEGATTFRLVLGAIILSLVMQPWRGGFKPGNWRPLVAYGLALGGMNLLFYMSLKTIPLGIAVALEFTGPLALALFSSRRALDFAWIALAIAGLWMLLPTNATDAPLDPVGALLALSAGVCWAIYIIYGQKAGAAWGRNTVVMGTWVAACVALPFGIWQAGTGLLNVDLLPIALAVAVFSSALPYSLEMIALTRLPARTFSVMMSLEPAIAAMLGMILLSEQLLSNQWLGILAIIIASAGASATIKPQN